MHAPIFEPATLHEGGPRVEGGDQAIGLNTVALLRRHPRGPSPEEAPSEGGDHQPHAAGARC